MRMIYRVLLMVLLLTGVRDSLAFIDTSSTASNSVTGLWWNANEAGWGMTLTQQGSVVFVAMFTYDASSNPTWFMASACMISGGSCTGDFYRVRGGRAPTAPWSGAAVAPVKVGTITLNFGSYNAGVANFSIDGSFVTKDISRNIFATATPPPLVDDNKTRTERLIGGTWTYVYSISTSTFTQRYSFNSSQASTASPGEWNAIGADEFGNLVIGAYSPRLSAWAVLDPGSIIDRFFVFTFSDNNRVTGCYHQINPPGSTNIGSCYSMAGTRSPAKATRDAPFLDTQVHEEVLARGKKDPQPEPEVVEAYLRAREEFLRTR